MTRTTALGPSLLVEALEGVCGCALRGHCLLPSEGGCLGCGLGCAVFVHRECAGSAIISGKGWGIPPLHTFVFVQDFPLLRPAYVGTCVGHVWYT